MEPKAVAELYSLPLSLTEKVMKAIGDGQVLFLGVSGKIGAGKDTVAPLVAEGLGFTNASHLSFAKPLREEMNVVIEIVKKSSSVEEASKRVADQLEANNVQVAIEALYDEVKSGAVTNSYQRTPGTRTALQWWGTEVRRAQDENYWVKKAVRMAFDSMAEGGSIYVTDARFPNEADAITNVGGFLLRLVVSEEEQARRIINRDGDAPKKEALNHLSETALDDYSFDHLIDTDSMGLEGVVESAISMGRKQ